MCEKDLAERVELIDEESGGVGRAPMGDGAGGGQRRVMPAACPPLST